MDIAGAGRKMSGMGLKPGSRPGPEHQRSVALPRVAERGRSAASLPPGATQPTVLFVGTDDAYAGVVASALKRHGVHLEQASPEAALAAAVVTAPDLIVLAARAAEGGGERLLEQLKSRPETSVIPVALIQEEAALDERLKAFRHGAAALLPKKASVEELARRIAELARKLPEGTDTTVGQIGEVTLDELLDALGAKLRSGILSVEDPEGKGSLRLVLGSGQPIAALIEDFVQRAREHIHSAEPLRYEFDARAGGTIQLLSTDPSESAEVDEVRLTGLRVVLGDDNASRAEAVAHELRRYGAEVIVSDLAPSETRFAQIRVADPSVLLIGEGQLQQDAGYELVRRMRQDTRLRWASLLVVRWAELWRDERTASVERLASALRDLTEPEGSLLAQAQELTCFDTRLETVGPARTLRSLAPARHGMRVTITNPRLQAELDLADGLLVGALARTLSEPAHVFEGIEAVAAVLQLSSGRVQIDRVAHPARANVMATVDMALGLADGERPPIHPSTPAAPEESATSDTASSTVPEEPAASSASTPTALAESALGAVAMPTTTSLSPQVPDAPFLPSIPTQAGNAAEAAQQPLSVEALLGGGSADLGAFSLSTSPHESAAPPPQELPAAPEPPVSEAAASAPLSLPLSPIDLRLRALLHVDERGPGARLLVILGALLLLQLLWILVVVGSSVPTRKSPLTPATDVSAPLATKELPAPAPQEPTPPPAPSVQGARPSPADATPNDSTPHDSTPNDPAPNGSAPESGAPTLPAKDGSAESVPTCDALLKDEPAPGPSKALANQEARAALQALSGGKLAKAQEHYCRSLRADDTSALVWSGLAQVFLLQRDATQARSAAEKSLALNPNDTTAQLVLADAVARLGEVDEAKALWKKAAKLFVDDARAFAGLAKRDLPEARRAERAANWPLAERLYRRVALLEPTRPEGPAGLSRSLSALGVSEAASLWAEYAVRVAPGSTEAWLARGDALRASGNEEAARAAFEKARALDPKNPQIRQRLR